MRFELYGYGSGSAGNSKTAKQYRRLRVELDIEGAKTSNQDGPRHYGIVIGGTTVKQSELSDNNRCVLSFKEASAAESLDMANFFVGLSCCLLQEQARHKALNFSRDIIPPSNPKHLASSVARLRELADDLERLIAERNEHL